MTTAQRGIYWNRWRPTPKGATVISASCSSRKPFWPRITSAPATLVKTGNRSRISSGCRSAAISRRYGPVPAPSNGFPLPNDLATALFPSGYFPLRKIRFGVKKRCPAVFRQSSITKTNALKLLFFNNSSWSQQSGSNRPAGYKSAFLGVFQSPGMSAHVLLNFV